jgi:UDP-sulfoquinovose synthase
MKTVMILGGDGYLGWSIALALASRSDTQVVIVDSYGKRKWEKETGVMPLFPIPYMGERIYEYGKLTGRHNMLMLSIDVANSDLMDDLVKRYPPDAIINAAQQPSAPYSMMDPNKARFTIENNNSTCLSVLWTVAKNCPDTLVINIGSAGAYLSIDADFIPKKKVNFQFNHHGMLHSVLNSWLPMQASDFYHQSKANTFALTDICTKLWNLRCVTMMQSIIFGNCIPENRDSIELATRFSYDHVFGTVLNRFVCQAAIKHPLTVYGDGEVITGLSCLPCAVDSYIRLLDYEVKPGMHLVENNFTHRLSIKQIAKRISELSGVEAQYIPNPRDGEDNCTLGKTFEAPVLVTENDVRTCDGVIEEMLDFARRFSYNINTNHILPQVKWRVNGHHK